MRGDTASRTMHGRAINGICPRQLVGDIIEEIPLHEHLVKYVKGMYRNCRRMPTTNLSSIILPSHQFLSRSVIQENETKLRNQGSEAKLYAELKSRLKPQFS